MKTAKLVIGIISIILFVLISLQSCVAGLGNALTASGEVSGTAGFLLAVCMLVAGIVGIATRNGKKGGAYTAAGFYLFGALIAASNAGSYGDLTIWAFLSAIFGIVYIVGTLKKGSKKNTDQID